MESGLEWKEIIVLGVISYREKWLCGSQYTRSAPSTYLVPNGKKKL